MFLVVRKNKICHFGNSLTSTTKDMHHIVKQYLGSIKFDLFGIYQCMEFCIRNMHKEYVVQLSCEKMCILTFAKTTL